MGIGSHLKSLMKLKAPGEVLLEEWEATFTIPSLVLFASSPAVLCRGARVSFKIVSMLD